MSAPLNYRGLILDFGAVITKLPFETLDVVEDSFGLKRGSLDWRGPIEPERDPLWRDVVAGIISERDYWPIRAREISEPRGETWTAADLFVRIVEFNGEAWLRSEMLAIIQEARARGARVAILSNELELFIGKTWIEKFSVFKMVDALIDATTTHIFKPDPRSYQLALDALGMQAGEALFVDDQPRNVEGARAAGLTALPFDIAHVDASLASVREALGLPPSIR